MQQLRKIQVHTLTPKFREGTRIVLAPVPAPSATQVAVRMHWVGINASDVNASAGRYSPGTKPPFDIGFEGVGVVQSVGATAAARGFAVGGAVAVVKMGCFTDVVLVDVEKEGCYAIDHAVPEVVPLLIGGLTSSIGLEVAGELRSGETVLVTGASGGTGLFAVQLAAIAGNRVIGTCGTDDKMVVLKRLGCERPINYKTEDLESVLKAEYPEGIDLIFEGVGGRMLEACKRCVKPNGGRLVIMGFTSQYQKADGFDSAEAKLVKDRSAAALRGFLLKDHPKLQAPHLAKLTALVKEGKLQPVVDGVEPLSGRVAFDGLEAVADAVEYLHAGKNVGKPVVRLCADALLRAPPTAVAADNGPLVGSMERALEMQAEAFADDVEVGEHMLSWSEARLMAYLENGGE